MFAIVEWLEVNQVSVVPLSWVTNADGETLSYWPPNKLTAKTKDNMIRKQLSPEKDWPRYPVRVIKTEEKYESAAKKCKVAEYTSSLSTAESDVERENRRIRCRTFPSEHDSPPAKQKQCRTIPRNVTEHMSNQEFMVPPPAPATLLTFDNCSKSDCGDDGLAGRNEAMSDNDIASDIEPTTDAFPMNNDHSRPNSGCDIITPGRCPRPVSHAASQSRRYCQQTDSTPLSRHLPVPGVPHGVSEMSVRSRIQPVIQSLRAAHRQSAENVEKSTLQLLLHQVAEVREDIRTMKTGLNELLRRQRGLDGIRTGRLPDNVKLPVMTPPEMRSLEQQLDSHEVYSQLVAHLALVGGDSTRNCTYNVMVRCMDNSFALNHYTWVGRSENKESFSALKLKCVIIDAVRRNPLTAKSTDADIGNSMKLWLRGAGDRGGGRAKRARKAFHKKSASSRGRRSPRQCEARRSTSQSSCSSTRSQDCNSR